MNYLRILLLTSLLLFAACMKKGVAPVTTAPYSMSDMSEVSSMPSSPAPSPIPVPVLPKKETSIQSGTLTAGEIDDNLNLKQFKQYIDKALQSTQETHLPYMSTKDRFMLKVVDQNGKGINRAKVSIGNFRGYTNASGLLYLFPEVDDIDTSATTVMVNEKRMLIDLMNTKSKIITLAQYTALPQTLDLQFVIDTTGSMGDEMAYLEKEFSSIVSNVKSSHPSVNIRFGLTVYKDKGDAYVVKNFDFTADTDKMLKQLKAQSANGGGDYPEAMEVGVEQGLSSSWEANNGVRMMFLLADAPPHDEKIKKMLPLIKKARALGIRIYPLGASGVGDNAEYIMRHLALFTQGRYLWLTDDSGVGNTHAEPKVACYQVTRLDQLIARVIKSELSGIRVEATKGSIIRSVGNYEKGVCQE